VAHDFGTAVKIVYCIRVKGTQPTMITLKDALSQLNQFVEDTHADLDLAYDWVAEMTGIYRICDDKELWHEFYTAYEIAADNAMVANRYSYENL